MRQEDGVLVKVLSRLGSDLSSTMVVDRSIDNIKYDRAMGIDLPWHGEKKDIKLLTLLELLLPLSKSVPSLALRKSPWRRASNQ